MIANPPGRLTGDGYIRRYGWAFPAMPGRLTEGWAYRALFKRSWAMISPSDLTSP